MRVECVFNVDEIVIDNRDPNTTDLRMTIFVKDNNDAASLHYDPMSCDGCNNIYCFVRYDGLSVRLTLTRKDLEDLLKNMDDNSENDDDEVVASPVQCRDCMEDDCEDRDNTLIKCYFCGDPLDTCDGNCEHDSKVDANGVPCNAPNQKVSYCKSCWECDADEFIKGE
jgi:hypothetical protein